MFSHPSVERIGRRIMDPNAYLFHKRIILIVGDQTTNSTFQSVVGAIPTYRVIVVVVVEGWTTLLQKVVDDFVEDFLCGHGVLFQVRLNSSAMIWDWVRIYSSHASWGLLKLWLGPLS
jgi:hypothetical protein